MDFWFCQKFNPLMCPFLKLFVPGKFVMILQKSYIWEKSGPSVMAQNALNQSNCMILKTGFFDQQYILK